MFLLLASLTRRSTKDDSRMITNYAALFKELTDPATAPTYAALTDAQVAAALNNAAGGSTRARRLVSGGEILAQIDNAAWPTTAVQQDKLRAILGAGAIDPTNVNVRGIIASIFPNSGATAATLARLVAIASEAISRSDELQLGGSVSPGDVARAREGKW